VDWSGAPWPSTEGELLRAQQALARDAKAALATAPWRLPPDPLVCGCFVAFAPGDPGPGQAGDPGWAAAVAWRPSSVGAANDRPAVRRSDQTLRRRRAEAGPRRATDVDDQVVVADRARAPYRAGFLALREGPILERAVTTLRRPPDVLLVDATGLDHPRRAGLAVHLGAVVGVPSVGVTHRPLVALGSVPPMRRGATAPVQLDGQTVGVWTCTKPDARPVLAHAGWRTDPDTAAALVLAVSTPAARTPVPLQEARRVAREARAVAASQFGRR
jgi:deoxyribonuclease V